MAALALGMVAGPTTATATVSHTRESNHKFVHTMYFPDDICGPRAGWTTFVTTDHLVVTDLGDSFHVVFGENGRYTTDFDDPAIPDFASQFTDAVHVNLTRGGTEIYTEQFHDYPGTIRIRVHIVFVAVDGDVRVDRDVLSVTGCP